MLTVVRNQNFLDDCCATTCIDELFDGRKLNILQSLRGCKVSQTKKGNINKSKHTSENENTIFCRRHNMQNTNMLTDFCCFISHRSCKHAHAGFEEITTRTPNCPN